MRASRPPSDGEGFRCEFCGGIFQDPRELRGHRTAAHLSRPSAPRCDACGQTFESPADLKAHNQATHGAPAE